MFSFGGFQPKPSFATGILGRGKSPKFYHWPLAGTNGVIGKNTRNPKLNSEWKPLKAMMLGRRSYLPTLPFLLTYWLSVTFQGENSVLNFGRVTIQPASPRISPFQKEFAPEATEPIGALSTIVPGFVTLIRFVFFQVNGFSTDFFC